MRLIKVVGIAVIFGVLVYHFDIKMKIIEVLFLGLGVGLIV